MTAFSFLFLFCSPAFDIWVACLLSGILNTGNLFFREEHARNVARLGPSTPADIFERILQNYAENWSVSELFNPASGRFDAAFIDAFHI